MRMQNIPLGVYIPGDTLIHRIPPAAKLLSLFAFTITATWLASTPIQATIAVLIPLPTYIIARIPIRIALGQIWPPIPFLLALGAFQWWQAGWEKALTTTLVILAAIIAAVIITLTTTTAAMMESLERTMQPLARFGFPAETISLAISLTLRLIPLQLATVYEVLDARKARGADFSVTAFGTPVMIRSIRRAQAIGDALHARGIGD
ncbi:Energy-coupling factor transporter transmembrane protein EcfT [Corynebacterium freiburgense]|nr:Energy-coupling factor transporter transmembrane protein EcfT [Corynebacterium freiburgense]